MGGRYWATIGLVLGFELLLLSVCLADPSQDIIGIYFDQGGTITTSTTTVLNEQVIGYLIIQNASDHSGFKGYTGSIAFAPFTPIYEFTGTLCGCALVPPDIYISCPLPIAWAPSIVMGQVAISVPTPSDSLSIYVKPTLESSQGPDYWNSSYYHFPLTPSSGSFDLPVATINSAPPVEVNSSTWGDLKSLYR